MAYMCKQSDRECDACGCCEPDPMFYCAGCRRAIYADESSFMMGWEIVCGECWVTGIEEEKTATKHIDATKTFNL